MRALSLAVLAFVACEHDTLGGVALRTRRRAFAPAQTGRYHLSPV